MVFDGGIDPGKLPEPSVHDGDYILLSDEDLEELLFQNEEAIKK